MNDERWHAGPVNEDYAKENEADLQEQMAENSAYGAELRAEVAAIRKHLAVVQDGSGYHAALKTREGFGCVMWEISK